MSQVFQAIRKWLGTEKLFERVIKGYDKSWVQPFLEGNLQPFDQDLSAVSLFSNTGIGDYGYSFAGFDFKVFAELVPERLSVARSNFPRAEFVEGDLRETWPEVVERYEERTCEPPDLLSACPPCQGMSSSNPDRGKSSDPKRGSQDDRNLLVSQIVNVAEKLEPKVIIVENVLEFLTRKVVHPRTGAPVTAPDLLIEDLSRNYVPYISKLNLADFGVPQMRKRSFITLVHEKISSTLLKAERTPFPVPTHGENGRGSSKTWVTASDALGGGKYSSLNPRSKKGSRDPNDPLHFVPVLDDRRYEMIRSIPKNSGRNAYQNDKCPSCGHEPVPEGRATCDKCGSPMLNRPIVEEEGSYRLVRGFHTSYRRMQPNKPANTVTTASNHLGSSTTLHPWENRVLSPRECADLQTIPRNFNWEHALQSRRKVTILRETIGEAVPPLFTFRHGCVIFDLLTSAQFVDDYMPVDSTVAVK